MCDILCPFVMVCDDVWCVIIMCMSVGCLQWMSFDIFSNVPISAAAVNMDPNALSHLASGLGVAVTNDSFKYEQVWKKGGKEKKIK